MPHLNHVATLPCNVSLITVHVSGCYCFLDIIFHKIVWRHVWGVVGYFITALLHIYC